MISPANKRTFIASMNKYNPYRITNITDSMYNKIMQSREPLSSPNTPRNPKAIYLPPVKIEESSIKTLKNPRVLQNDYQFEPVSIEASKNSMKIDFPILSKSLDFTEVEYQEKAMLAITKKSATINHKKTLFSRRMRRKSEDTRDGNMRTMSAMQQRDTRFRLPSKFKENNSPWAFQVFKYL